MNRCLDTQRHLTKDEQVKLGSYYTPERLVELVLDMIKPHILALGPKTVVLDNAAGYGAFLAKLSGVDLYAGDCDPAACEKLREILPHGNVLLANSLVGVDRKMFKIPKGRPLIVIGNPPYNDTTSEFRSGRKGMNECDPDLYDRDLGITFLRSFDKLGADVVCVLHPLSYLIKRANFTRLKSFREHYRLERGVIFPSSLFVGTGQAKFPVVAALYIRDEGGIDHEQIRDFIFEILDGSDCFCLADYQTTDGFINKYPTRSEPAAKSDIGIYYYTFRDINTVRRNASFLMQPHPNGIAVSLENLYQYAYLHAFKMNFKPDNAWLFGNLSPLVNQPRLEKYKDRYVAYVMESHPVLRGMRSSVREKIRDHYGLDVNSARSTSELEKWIYREINDLAHIRCVAIETPEIVLQPA